ncbi:MAG: polyphosphate polymerase domain-containing protein [Lachnospiraceae bacterium]|nr:polyphosphate polymerase domain-containing protein [Candidatus Colinaster scatohippi]
MDYRVEQKYFVTEEQIAYLLTSLVPLVSLDSHITGASYVVRSVYFDDMYDTCLFENENGSDDREKFRIRTYNNNSDMIHLELKSKKHGFTAKKSVEISKEEADILLEKGTIFRSGERNENDGNSYLKDKISSEMIYRQLRPVCIVEYERTAFVDPLGNVRVTFDRNIGCCNNVEEFFDEYPQMVPVLPSGRHILEVKYDEILPDYIKEVLDGVNLKKTAFSKYYYGRMQNML